MKALAFLAIFAAQFSAASTLTLQCGGSVRLPDTLDAIVPRLVVDGTETIAVGESPAAPEGVRFERTELLGSAVFRTAPVDRLGSPPSNAVVPRALFLFAVEVSGKPYVEGLVVVTPLEDELHLDIVAAAHVQVRVVQSRLEEG